MSIISRSIALLGASLVAAGCASTPESTAASAPNVSAPAVQVLTYHCTSGTSVKATYPTDSVALVRYEGTTQQLQVVRAASGVRYINNDFEWWTQGSGIGATAMLSRRDSENVMERCQQVAPDS